METTRIALAPCLPWLPRRPRDCHKGDFGSVGILGGGRGMAGAALLAARAALWTGAGRVYAGLLDERVAVDVAAPEVMVCAPARVLEIAPPGCLVAGPGMGHPDIAKPLLQQALDVGLPLLVDADGLNLLARDAALQTRLGERTAPTVLTPHPGEAARLLGWPTGDIQADRVRAIHALGERFRCIVVLKGAGTLVHAAGRPIWENATGNPGMASPGMGDVLAGMIAALCAQGLDMEKAAVLGVHLHGAAGDAAVAAGSGPLGLTAGEVALTARQVLNGWLRQAV